MHRIFPEVFQQGKEETKLRKWKRKLDIFVWLSKSFVSRTQNGQVPQADRFVTTFCINKGFFPLFSSSSNLFKDGVTPCVRWYIEYRISFLNPTLASVRSLGKVWKSMISSYFLKIFYPQYLLIVYLRVYLYSGFSKNVVCLKNVSLSMFQIFSVWQTGLQMHHVLSTSGWLYIHYITTWCMHSECMQCNAM